MEWDPGHTPGPGPVAGVLVAPLSYQPGHELCEGWLLRQFAQCYLLKRQNHIKFHKMTHFNSLFYEVETYTGYCLIILLES